MSSFSVSCLSYRLEVGFRIVPHNLGRSQPERQSNRAPETSEAARSPDIRAVAPSFFSDFPHQSGDFTGRNGGIREL